MRVWLEQRQAGVVPDYTAAEDYIAAEDSTAAEDSPAVEAATEQDDDARLRAEVLAYMEANRVTRAYLGASTEVDLRETTVRTPRYETLTRGLPRSVSLKWCPESPAASVSGQ